MRNGMNKLLAVTAVLACVCMWGCTDVDFRWEKGRSSETGVGFVDDSLVMVGDYRCWLEIRDSWIMASEESSGCGRERLCVYNYRVQEDGPRWCDSLPDKKKIGIFGGQMIDSVIWGGEVSKTVRLWKIGERPHEIKLTKESDGCSVEFRISSLKPWLDGTFIGRSGESLAADGDTCNYVVLDTLLRTLTYRRLDKDLEWIKECDDVRAWGEDVYCLWKNDDKSGFYLEVNNQKKDSVLVANVPHTTDLWKSFEFGFMGDMLYFGHNINSIDVENKRIIIYPNIKATSAFNYVDENDNNVNYEFVQE